MNSITQQPNFCRRMALLAILTGTICLFPQSAQAGCGDYVLVNGHPASVSHHGVSHSTTNPKPCQGPACSRHEQSPLTPPVTPVPVVSDQFALLSGNPFVSLPQSEFSPPQDEVLTAKFSGQSLFRPPRAA